MHTVIIKDLLKFREKNNNNKTLNYQMVILHKYKYHYLTDESEKRLVTLFFFSVFVVQATVNSRKLCAYLLM